MACSTKEMKVSQRYVKRLRETKFQEENPIASRNSILKVSLENPANGSTCEMANSRNTLTALLLQEPFVRN